ncbi:MAG: 50S ribosomal protein L9 [Planctomycetes bacterium]|nr:50S ribosomal protein L9 [Planctomycetota bacterium]
MVEVLLWHDVPKLGKRGDVLKVSDGYARNYLLPRKLVSMATKENLKQLESYKKRMKAEEEKAKLALQQAAGELENASSTIEVKANEEGVLFGAVSQEMIAESLQKQGWKQIKAEMIEIETPIKELGVYRVKVKLESGVSATCKVWIVEQSLEKQD